MISGMPALLRHGSVWMSLTPLETESQGIGLAFASGHVAVLGMGLGWAAAQCALRSTVTRVTVVESDPDVIALHEMLNLFAQLPGDCGRKVSIVHGDAFAWRPDTAVDLLLPDIWLPLVSEHDRAEEVRRMQDNIGARAIHFWGQELEIARHAVAAGRALDDAGISATVATFGLPLVGPQEPDYAMKLQAAAKAWMRGRWLPGSRDPFLTGLS